jgi:hypothetical protein
MKGHLSVIIQGWRLPEPGAKGSVNLSRDKAHVSPESEAEGSDKLLFKVGDSTEAGIKGSV